MRSERVGAWLVDTLAVSPGDVVSFIARNRVELLDLYLACGKIGAIVAPLSYRLKKRELDDLLGRIKPQVFIHEVCFAELVEMLTMPASVRRTICIDDAKEPYVAEVLATEPRTVNVPLRMSDTFMYIHTGGTTAVPKICIVPHRQMVWNSVDIMATGYGGAQAKTELLTFPLFHIGGWNTFTPVFHCGNETVLLREFDPGTVLSLIDQGCVEHFGAVEAMLRMIMAHPSFETTDFSAVSGISTAGAPCAEEVMKTFVGRGVPVAQSYGLTEGGPSNFAFMGRSGELEEYLTYADSIGTPMFHTDHRIVHRDTRVPLGRGEVGVLCLRSPHTFGGYLGDPERTAKLIDDEGWVFTGDMAVEDADGMVRIVGRADNMFISGGENVSPEEVEQVVMMHEAVAEALCAGVPDARWGQVPAVLVVVRQGHAWDVPTLRAFCKEHLAGYKVPRHVKAVEALPLTGAGKVDRKAVEGLMRQGEEHV
ncbi:MAG: AMP-binding protein [Myxococcota bacterium]